jgi:uncharacterized protein (DUF1501 family)
MPFDERNPQPCPEPGTGLSRRRFLAGTGAMGASILAGQLVTTKVAYGATTPGANTVIVIFLRGGADGLRILSPQSASLGGSYLRTVRPALVPLDSQAIALDGTAGWALHPAMAPLHSLLWAAGQMTFVPAVSHPGVSRSHFQAQQFVELGGSTAVSTGWLDRVLHQLGPGTTFRALGEGFTLPMSMAGNEPKISMSSLADFDFPGTGAVRTPAMTALRAMYRGIDGPLGEDVTTALGAVATAAAIRASAAATNAAAYPTGPTAAALRDIAAILRAEVGLQVATLDVSSWDTHTTEAAGLDALLANTAQALAAFFTDLGAARRSRVTVVVMSEFGRRVAMNASAGTDHGHGGLVWLLGGGLLGRTVHGKWIPLSSDADLDNGDIRGLNDPFDICGEIVQKRLGVGSLTAVFPGHSYTPLGLARSG